tara:strand:+ start:299 stop:565 length:267 start_codon:yes stop_codon:yes gene_type:complete
MSKVIKCACGGVYTNLERHKKQRKHLDYEFNYVECMVLLVTEKFTNDDRIEQAKQFLNDKLKDCPNKVDKLSSIRKEYTQLQQGTIQI